MLPRVEVGRATKFYGEAETNDGDVDVGWMQRALDRAQWREGETQFVCA